jgi:hypothetical protein
MSDRDLWCQFYAAIISGYYARHSHSLKDAAEKADEALAELKARDEKKAFDKPEGSYRQG